MYFVTIYRMMSRQQRKRSDAMRAEDDSEVKDQDETFDVSPKIVVIFVIVMCTMLVLLYFLYDYLGKLH